MEHVGEVIGVDWGGVTVRIPRHSACGSCQAKPMCGMDTGSSAQVRISAPGLTLSVGDRVRVHLKRSLGVQALMLGYTLPFILVLAMLIALTATGMDEGMAGLASLAVLLPYYLGLYLLRHRMARRFTFTLEPYV